MEVILFVMFMVISSLIIKSVNEAKKLTPEQRRQLQKLRAQKNDWSCPSFPVLGTNSCTHMAGTHLSGDDDDMSRGLWDPASIYYPLFHSNDGMDSGIGLSDGCGLSHFGLDDSFGSSGVSCSGPFDSSCGCGIGSGFDDSTHW